jgi:dienelactone hydrolase
MAMIKSAVRFFSLLAAAVFQFHGASTLFAQTNFHHLTEIARRTDGTIAVGLGGAVPALFHPYFDIYLLESSADLREWRPHAILVRTNNFADPFFFFDLPAETPRVNFYRTATNLLMTPFVKPSGSYGIGTTSLLVTDSTRTNRYNVKTNGSFMISIWYPATIPTGMLPAGFTESKLAPRLSNFYSVSPGILSNFFCFSFADLPVKATQTPYPVVIYSHGFAINRRDNTAKCEELASHGYFVVAIDHADCFGTVFPDGRLLTSSISQLSAALFDSDLADFRFVLAELERLNREDARFAGSMDLRRIGVMGWSYGGGVAGEICRTDERVLAVVMLDSYLQDASALLAGGFQKPFLGMYNAGSSEKRLFNQAVTNAYWMIIKGTQHQHFSDWLAWFTSPTLAGRRAGVAMNACMLSFFDKFLKGQDDHLLDNPAATYPEVLNFEKK